MMCLLFALLSFILTQMWFMLFFKASFKEMLFLINKYKHQIILQNFVLGVLIEYCLKFFKIL